MKRRDVDYVLIAGMFLSGLYVAATGLIADLFGLHQFAFHRYAGYLCAVLVLAHLLLNRKRVAAYVGRWTRPGKGNGRQDRTTSQTTDQSRRQAITAVLSAAGGFLVGWLVPRERQDLPTNAADIGALYHEWSTPSHSLDLPLPDWGDRPSGHKTYPEAERIVLPDPDGFRGLTVEEALEARRSRRNYGASDVDPLSMGELSRLVHAAQGITHEPLAYRAAPSAGALYPIEVYPVVHRVAGLASGIYHYAVRSHALERVLTGDFRSQVTRAGLYQTFLGQANVCFLLSAVFQRTRWKYRQRAYRYVMLEAGHVAQNLYLAATSMGLGACAVGAFYDGQLNRLLDLDAAEEATVYLISVGRLA